MFEKTKIINYISSFLLFFMSIFFHLCKFKKSFVIENYPTPTWRWHPNFFDLWYDVDGVLDPAEFYLFIDLGVFSLSYNLFSLFVYDVKTLKDDLFENEEVFGRLDEKNPDWLGLKGTSWNSDSFNFGVVLCNTFIIWFENSLTIGLLYSLKPRYFLLNPLTVRFF